MSATRVETADAMEAALQLDTWDIVLSDYGLPTFNAPDALAFLRKTGLDVSHSSSSLAVCSQNPILSKITLCSGDSRRKAKSSRESLKWGDQNQTG